MSTICAALSWYDEPIEELVACVRGVARIADRLVALDGAYRRYPGAQVKSPADQAAAIQATAEAEGLECLVVTPERLWAGQVEKRTYLMALAGVRSAWTMIVDSDHVVVRGDRAQVHRWLDHTDAAWVKVPYWYPEADGRDLAEVASTRWAEGLAGRTEMTAHFIRSIPGLRVERFHYWYAAPWRGRESWLAEWVTDSSRPMVPAAELPLDYVVEHRCLLRTPDKILGNRAFCNDRVMVVDCTGQEDDVPGLPAPDFDFASRLV